MAIYNTPNPHEMDAEQLRLAILEDENELERLLKDVEYCKRKIADKKQKMAQMEP
jgi:hypothetical protein